MTWTKIDDRLHSHPKARRAGLEAMGLWVLCLSFCGAYNTDGRIGREDVEAIGGRRALTLADRLVGAGLWDRDGTGYVFHDFLAYNPSAAQVEAERTRKAEAGRRGGLAKAASAGRSHGTSLAPASPVLPEPAVLPIPARPVPDPDPSGGCTAGPAPSPAKVPERKPARRGEPEPTLPGVDDPPPKAEGPDSVAWRTWRAAYAKHYGRNYPPQSTDGPAMKRLSKLAVDMCAELGRALPEDLERLHVHRWRRYLADPGQARHAGAKGYLAETCHRLQDVERGLASYGTPWDRDTKPANAPLPPPADEPRRPRVVPPPKPLPPELEAAGPVDAVAIFGGRRGGVS